MLRFIGLLISLFVWICIILSTVHFACFLLDNPQRNLQTELHKEDWKQALFIDVCLLVFWTAAHSMHRVLKKPSEAHPLQRTTHLAVSAVAFEVLMRFWIRIPHIVLWSFSTSSVVGGIIFVCHVVAWSVLVLMSVFLDHLELVGVKQTWTWCRASNTTHSREREETASFMSERQQLYSHMRHPALLPFVIVLWMTPHFTLDRLLLAVWLTAYLLLSHSLTHNDLQYVEHQLLITFKRWVEDLNPFTFRIPSR